MKKKIRQLVRFKDRQAILLARRSLKMARSAHAYVRRNTRMFYEWLEKSDVEKLPRGPAVWICGDCHVGNIGPIANAEGHIDIQIRDLDQTVIGNPAHDLIRLGLSLTTAARGSDLQLQIEHLNHDQAMRVAWFLAAIVGHAHARQMNPSAKQKWREELQRHRTAKLDAPSWLWSSIVELLVSHEGEYLEHCRKYAMVPPVS